MIRQVLVPGSFRRGTGAPCQWPEYVSASECWLPKRLGEPRRSKVRADEGRAGTRAPLTHTHGPWGMPFLDLPWRGCEWSSFIHPTPPTPIWPHSSPPVLLTATHRENLLLRCVQGQWHRVETHYQHQSRRSTALQSLLPEHSHSDSGVNQRAQKLSLPSLTKLLRVNGFCK